MNGPTPSDMNEPTLTVIDSPVGPLGLGADADALTQIVLRMRGPAYRGKLRGVLADAARQLAAYFAGRLRNFDVPLAPQGTPFQREVWKALRTIKYGETWSYRELAEYVGRPAAVRAVGAANGQNPIPIIIPCHRVIGSNGTLVGFGGGIEMKQKLLALEGARLF
jgi:methylated-DNA-[protein]-cysteine S-methyltransferase